MTADISFVICRLFSIFSICQSDVDIILTDRSPFPITHGEHHHSGWGITTHSTLHFPYSSLLLYCFNSSCSVWVILQLLLF